jgi:ribosomal-protein-alanine N-acetyltransferase
LDFFADLNSDEEVRRYLGGPVAPEQITALFRAGLAPDGTRGLWVTEQKLSLRPVGLVMLHPHKDGADYEISYMFASLVWGQGLAYEATQAILDHGLGAAGLPRIIAETQVANCRSSALLGRLGMKEIARLERFGAMQSVYATSERCKADG